MPGGMSRKRHAAVFGIERELRFSSRRPELNHDQLLRLKIRPTQPYTEPAKPSSVACSISSRLPNLLVHSPCGSCLAVCVGIRLRSTYMAIFSNPGSNSEVSHGVYPRVRKARVWSPRTRYPIPFSDQSGKETFDLLFHQRKPCSLPHLNHALAISSIFPLRRGSTGSTSVMAFKAQNQWSGSRSSSRSNSAMASRPMPIIC